jgi:hypothetical protein
VPRPAIADAVADFVMLSTSSRLMLTRPGPARLHADEGAAERP